MKEAPIKVKELIAELLLLDQEAELVIPGAPYDVPQYLTRVGIVILKEDEQDTGVKAGEYIGLGIGNDFYEDLEEPMMDNMITSPSEQVQNKEDKSFPSFDTMEEFEKNLFETLFEK